MTFAERLAEYRASLDREQHVRDYLDSLDGRGGICARDAAEAYADEMTEEDQLTVCVGDPLLEQLTGRKAA